MADWKLSDLAALASPQQNVKILVLDVNDTSTAPADAHGSDKVSTLAQLLTTLASPGLANNLLVNVPSSYATGTFVGPGDANQYSNFNLADNVYPLDAAGHYWAFSHRKLPFSHSFVIFNYNGTTYLNVLTMFETGQVNTNNNVLDDSTGNMTLGGGLTAKVRTITTSGAVSATDSLLLLNAATLTATLPTAVGITGRQYTVKLITASTGTVATTSAQTIDGAASYSLSANHKYVTVVSDGANWQITANN